MVFRFVLSNVKLLYFEVYQVNLRNYQSVNHDFCYDFGKKVDFDHEDTYGHGIYAYENILIWHGIE